MQWSCRLCPTGRSSRTEMPKNPRSPAGPIPESISRTGDWYAPADTITSRSARTVSRMPPETSSTPTARSPSKTMRSTRTPVRTSRFGRPSAGRRNASAGLQRMPFRCVSWKRETPSGRSTFRSSMCAYPAATAASSCASIKGHSERLSETASGPPTPWNSFAPRSLSSERLK